MFLSWKIISFSVTVIAVNLLANLTAQVHRSLLMEG